MRGVLANARALFAPRVQRSDQGGKGSLPLRAYFGGLVVLVALAAAGGAWYVKVESDHDARASALREASSAATAGARLIDSGASSLQDALGTLAADRAALSQLFAHPRGCVLTFSPAGVFGAGHIDIVRSGGAVICSSLHVSGVRSLSYRREPWAPAASKRPQVLAPVSDPASGQPALILTVPVPGGFVAATADLRSVGLQLAAELASPRGLRYLVTSPGARVLLASSTAPAKSVGKSIAGSAFARLRARAQRPDPQGTTRLFAAASASRLGWEVYAGIEQAVALRPATTLFHRYLLLILGAVVVVLLAALVLERRIARPIRLLHGAMTEPSVSRAATVLARRAPTELLRLGGAFETLVARVETELDRRDRAQQAAAVAEGQARAAEGQARAAEAEMRTMGEAYRLLFEGNPLPMWIYDPLTLEIFEVNLAATINYGYAREQFLALTIADLRPAEDVPAMLASVAAGGSRDQSGPWRHLTADGRVITVEITSQEMEYRGRTGRLVVAVDVSERQRLQRQVSQTQRLESLGQLAGGVAHDFNNLLGVIINYAAFVAEQLAELPSARQIREDVEQIDRAARQATTLTRQLLAFARREVTRPEVLDLNEIVSDTEQLLKRTLGEHVRLTCTLAPALSPILADPGQLEQVLVNLAVNARDAMPAGGTLLIETLEVEVDQEYAATRPGLAPGSYVRLRVSDTGEGMEAAVIEHAFEPFFTTKPQGQGTGLGLATIYGIVTQLGGRVSIYSEVGIGTTVSVMIPTTHEAASPSGEATAPEELEGHGEQILLVEDESGVREVARRILERRGYRVHAAASGSEALALVPQLDNALDLVLTDAIMPGMLGIDLAAQITRDRPQVRVLFMSGYAAPMLGSTTDFPAGARVIEKPFTEQSLLVKVREALAADPSAELE